MSNRTMPLWHRTFSSSWWWPWEIVDKSLRWMRAHRMHWRLMWHITSRHRRRPTKNAANSAAKQLQSIESVDNNKIIWKFWIECLVVTYMSVWWIEIPYSMSHKWAYVVLLVQLMDACMSPIRQTQPAIVNRNNVRRPYGPYHRSLGRNNRR